MGPIHSYLELHKGLRTLLLCFCLGIASVVLFLGIAIHFFVFKGDEHGLVLLSLCVLTLILDILITSILSASLRRTYGRVFIAVSGAILVGATLVSVVIWRTHWFELVKELFQSIGTTH
jgi:hypothetical protein